MRRLSFIVVLFLVILFSVSPPVFAQMGMMGNYNNDTSSSSSSQTEQQYQQNLQNQVNDLLHSQNVSSVKELDCKKITDSGFEKIGDAWMDVRIGNEQIHQAMDNMMGGEGSQSLTQAHIQMGENYLGCPSSGNFAYNWMPMMQSFQNTTTGGLSPMMGWTGYNFGNIMGGFGIVSLIVGIVIFTDLILFGIWIWKQIRTGK